jgi:phenylacetate-coenzyme A ligase PaaK-like adenylate-forming protein
MLRSAARQAAGIVEAMRDERRSPDAVRALQDRRLRATVRHAWANSPFYRRKLGQAGLSPDDIQSVADLVRLPPTTKRELQAADPDEVIARGCSPADTVVEATSGSSGRVLRVHHSRAAYDRYAAFAFRHLREIGYRPWDRVAYTCYEPLPALPWEKIGLGGRQQVDLRRPDPRAYVEDLLRIRPDLITAYPSILLLVIRSATPAELARIRPRAIHLHSELLTAGIRAEIGQAFGCDCFDDYSTFEFHHVAYECRHHRYHVAADNVIVEFVRDGVPVGPGERGEMLLTGLTNHAMPLLRYAIGDVGVPSDELCPCGRGFPTMALIEGRVDDHLVMPSGRRLSPRMVNPAFENLPGILEHVLVQEAVDRVVVHLNVAESHRATAPVAVADALRELFGEPVQIETRLSTDLERGRTGKLRCIVSKVAA